MCQYNCVSFHCSQFALQIFYNTHILYIYIDTCIGSFCTIILLEFLEFSKGFFVIRTLSLKIYQPCLEIHRNWVII